MYTQSKKKILMKDYDVQILFCILHGNSGLTLRRWNRQCVYSHWIIIIQCGNNSYKVRYQLFIKKYICNELNTFCHRSWWTAFILIRLCPHWPPGQCHCSVTWDQPTGRRTVRKRGVQGWCTRCCLHCPLSSTQLCSAQLQQPFGYSRNSKSTGMAKN